MGITLELRTWQRVPIHLQQLQLHQQYPVDSQHQRYPVDRQHQLKLPLQPQISVCRVNNWFYFNFRYFVERSNFEGGIYSFIDIPVGTNCAPLLIDLSLYSYETDFKQGLFKKNEQKLARSFNFSFRYIYDVLSLNYSKLGDYVNLYDLTLRIP